MESLYIPPNSNYNHLCLLFIHLSHFGYTCVVNINNTTHHIVLRKHCHNLINGIKIYRTFRPLNITKSQNLISKASPVVCDYDFDSLL